MEPSERRRTARLLDELIDQAHRRCPDHPFRLHLPSGEDVHIPPHDPVGRCAVPGHAGFFRTRVAPVLGAWPVPPSRRGDLRCSMLPVVPVSGAEFRTHSCPPVWTDLGRERHRAPPRWWPWSAAG